MRRSLIFFAIGILSGLGLGSAVLLATESQNSAGLVVQFGDGRVVTACVNLGSDGQATGEELLRAANLPLVLEGSGVGSAVCRIDSEGCSFPAEPCFCKCSLQPGQACQYWSYSKLVNNTWQYSLTGASGSIVRAGAVDGWAWGSGGVSNGAQPPLYTFEQICLATAATNTPVAAPTATQPQPTAVLPSVEPPTETIIVINILPTDTATSTALPTETPSPTSIPVAVAYTATPTAALPATATQTAAMLTAAPASVPSALPLATLLPTSSPLVVTIAAIALAPTSVVLPATSAAPIVLPLIQAAAATAQPSATLPATSTATSPTTMVIMATEPTVVETPLPQEPASKTQDTTELMIILLAALLIAAWALGAKNREPRTKN